MAANEKTPEDFLNRLDELAMIIKNKKNNYDCKFTLSTIHSSKGLEYDTVYIMDVKDGVFPEKVVANRKKATDEEIKLTRKSEDFITWQLQEQKSVVHI